MVLRILDGELKSVAVIVGSGNLFSLFIVIEARGFAGRAALQM